MAKTIFIFQGGNQFAKIRTDEKKNIEVATVKTRGKYAPLTSLLKEEQVSELKKHTKDMNEEQFENYINSEFNKMGYQLKKKVKGD